MKARPSTSARRPCNRGLFVVGATIAGVAFGAAFAWLGVLAADLTVLTGRGWMGWALALGGVGVIALGLAGWGVRCVTEGPRGRFSVVWGPALGALAGGIAWRYGPDVGLALPGVVRDALHLPAGWAGYLVVGGAAGWLLAVYLRSENPLAAGAAFGLLPGALLGSFGGWGSELWYVSLGVGAMLAVPIFRISLLAYLVREGCCEGCLRLGAVVGRIVVAAIVGSLLCGLTPLGESWLPSLGLPGWLDSILQFLLAVPNVVANLLALPGGWLGGAGAGAVIGLLILPWDTEKQEFDSIVLGGVLVAGGLLGGLDWLTGGAVFTGLFGNWAAGAAAGSIISALVFAGVKLGEEGDDAVGIMLIFVVAAVLLGAGAGGLIVWLGSEAGLAPIAGGVLGMAAVGVAIGRRGFSTLDVPDHLGSKLVVAVLTALMGLGLFQVLVAAKGLRYLASGAGHQNDNDRRAVAELTRAAKWNPHASLIYILREQSNRRLKRYHQALADLARLIERNPRFARYYLQRGYVYADMREYAKAVEDFDRAIRLDPENAEAFLHRGWANHKLKHNDRALEDFTAALTLDAGRGNAYVGRGYAYYDLGQYENAVRDFTRAIELDYKDVRAHEGRGRVHLKQKKYELALGDFNTAVMLDATFANAYAGRGDAYLELGNYARAVGEYNEAIRLNPRLSAAFTGRGNAHRKLGDEARAAADYAIAKALKADAEAPD